jgi:hypothetical protein
MLCRRDKDGAEGLRKSLPPLATTSEHLGNPVKAQDYLNQAQIIEIDEQKSREIKSLIFFQIIAVY